MRPYRIVIPSLISLVALAQPAAAQLAFDVTASHVQNQRWFVPTLILLTILMALGSAAALSARRKLARRSAKSLGLSEERYRQIVESAQEGIAIIDREGVCTLANEEFARMIGRPLEEVLNKHFIEWVDPELHRTSHEIFARKKQGLSERYEIEVPTPAGLRYFSVFEKPMPSPDGRFAGYLATLTDLTERKLAETSIRRREADYRLLFESSPNAQLLIDRETFHIHNANAAACELLGYVREEFSRITALDLQTPEGLDSSRQLFANLVSPGRVMRQYRKKDRTVIDVAVYAHDQEFEGRPCRLLHVIDQTEHVRAANKLKEIQQMLALAQEIAQIGSLKVHLPGAPGEPLVRIWSDELCRMFGIHPDRAASGDLAILDFVHPDDVPAFSGNRQKILGKGMPVDGEHRIVRADGAVRYVRTTARLLVPGQQTVFAAVQDVTEQRVMRDKLEQSQRLDGIGQLAGGVAHDFNNLLTVINGYSKLILNGLDPESRLYRDIQQIADAGQQAAELTSRLLAFGRKQVLKPVVLDLSEVIREATPLLTGVAGEHVRLSTRFSGSPMLVKADATQMNQVLLNLVTNARDAILRSGSVTIETSHVTLDNEFVAANPDSLAGVHVRLSVIDTGLGMDAATERRIFEPFFTTKNRTGGTGLGLATVYGIVKQSGGSIHVGTGLGKGTRFDVFLPALAENSIPIAAKVSGGAGKLIFLVEDRAEVRQYVSGILTEHGYRVIEARNGIEALSLFRNIGAGVDLVLTDLVMPGIHGSELVERITALQPAKPIPVLFMSGNAEWKWNAGAARRAMTRLLEKPFSPEELLARVAQAIAAAAVSV
jgi:two-component system cell cycle sensor histidine kinase/response regulator CckA